MPDILTKKKNEANRISEWLVLTPIDEKGHITQAFFFCKVTKTDGIRYSGFFLV